jgi:hypothetical protein
MTKDRGAIHVRSDDTDAVARDYGFAPNPFFGVCTLATCKPKIRKAAAIGDWVVGTGSSRLMKKKLG